MDRFLYCRVFFILTNFIFGWSFSSSILATQIRSFNIDKTNWYVDNVQKSDDYDINKPITMQLKPLDSICDATRAISHKVIDGSGQDITLCMTQRRASTDFQLRFAVKYYTSKGVVLLKRQSPVAIAAGQCHEPADCFFSFTRVSLLSQKVKSLTVYGFYAGWFDIVVKQSGVTKETIPVELFARFDRDTTIKFMGDDTASHTIDFRNITVNSGVSIPEQIVTVRDWSVVNFNIPEQVELTTKLSGDAWGVFGAGAVLSTNAQNKPGIKDRIPFDVKYVPCGAGEIIDLLPVENISTGQNISVQSSPRFLAVGATNYYKCKASSGKLEFIREPIGSDPKEQPSPNTMNNSYTGIIRIEASIA